jgi:YebC/PmpR family DNA-binding regulatory protein
MAGHSKWANIKHRKGRADAKKGKAFSRVAKEIISAVKMGGSDQKNNPRLRVAVQKAREINFPSENIERNINKAMNADQADYSEVMYELYGYGGVGIIVEAMTDNRNRLASDIRIATNKRGGHIASPGAVAFNFDRKGIIQVAKKNALEAQLFSVAIEGGAEDFDATDDLFMIITDPTSLAQVKDAIAQSETEIEAFSLEMIPKTHVECDEEAVKDNLALIEWLENIEDVDTVYHNMKLPD